MGFTGEDWGKTICFGGRLHKKHQFPLGFWGKTVPPLSCYIILRGGETERPYFGTGDLEAFIEACFLEF